MRNSLTPTEQRAAECIGTWANFAMKCALFCLIFQKLVKH